MNRDKNWTKSLTLGDLGGAIGGLDQDVTALGTQGRGDRLGEGVHTLQELSTSLNTESQFLMADWVSIDRFDENLREVTESPSTATD